MVSGSEMVYFNGLLTKDNGQDGGNPKDGDYKISYQSGAGVQKGTYRFVFYLVQPVETRMVSLA